MGLGLNSNNNDSSKKKHSKHHKKWLITIYLSILNIITWLMNYLIFTLNYKQIVIQWIKINWENKIFIILIIAKPRWRIYQNYLITIRNSNYGLKNILIKKIVTRNNLIYYIISINS